MTNNDIFNMYFGIIDDPRCEVNVTHRLVDILKLVMIAVLCGMEKLESINLWKEKLMKGKIVTLSGISVIGKYFFRSYILPNNPNFQSLISVTTWSMRKGETNGIDKFFYTQENFEHSNQIWEFCIVNKVYENWYAYKKSQIQLCEFVINLITELFYKNVPDIKAEFKNVFSNYILPKDINKVKKELELRELEKGDLEKRFKAIDKELEYFYCNMDIFDSIIINDYTENTCILLQQIISENRRKK